MDTFKKPGILVLLMLFMAATRTHHFETLMHLPDASLAVFLLAGFFISNPAAFGILFLEAVLIDYLAITHFGVSDFCVTPAYWFLIPTYGVLWFAGRSYSRICQFTLSSLGVFTFMSLASVSAAFLISNGAFYAFSGRFPEMSLADYAARVSGYFLPYLDSALVYLVPAALIYAAFAIREHVHFTSHAGQ